MSWESLIAFNVVLAAALASPGAALLYSIKTTVSAGRVAGILTGLGLATAAAIWTLAAMLGLEVVFALFPWTYTVLKVAGALYLLFLAWQTWKHAHDRLGDAPTRPGKSILSGFLVNAGNPKSMLFAAAVIVVIFPEGLAPKDIAIIALNHLAVEILFYTCVAAALGSAPARQGYLSLKPIFDRIAATLLGALGLRLILDRS